MFIDPVKPAGGGGSILFFRDGEDNLLHLVERPVAVDLDANVDGAESDYEAALAVNGAAAGNVARGQASPR